MAASRCLHASLETSKANVRTRVPYSTFAAKLSEKHKFSTLGSWGSRGSGVRCTCPSAFCHLASAKGHDVLMFASAVGAFECNSAVLSACLWKSSTGTRGLAPLRCVSICRVCTRTRSAADSCIGNAPLLRSYAI